MYYLRSGWTRGKADVVYVADAFEVMARLNALLAERRLARRGALALRRLPPQPRVRRRGMKPPGEP